MTPKSTETVQGQASQKIPFTFHPRVFNALGSELVTNDYVALLELAKNSYDAGATRVDVRVGTVGSAQYFEIQDDGYGMDRPTIVDVWFVIATPYRLSHKSTSLRGSKPRRVSGEKGLGRLAAARLGRQLTLTTKTSEGPCWEVEVEWPSVANAADSAESGALLRRCASPPVWQHGTLIRITDLNRNWGEEDIDQLREQLARLLSPFQGVSDFAVYLTVAGVDSAQPLRIEPPRFLDDPPYKLWGHVDKRGRVSATYRFAGSDRTREVGIDEQLWSPETSSDSGDPQKSKEPASGPFDFELRVWDVDAVSISNLAERFQLKKNTIRGDIRRFHGISLYRDGVLVLPKSDAGKDWLGIDLRRVSKVGQRLSTSQLVGNVAITAEDNPLITDTSDRERLEDNRASQDFRNILIGVVKLLEDERAKDRELETRQKEQPFQDLFAALSPEPLTSKVVAAAERGAPAGEVVTLVEDYAATVNETVEKIERRLIQYSGLASLGTIAGMLTHEVRNHAIPIGRLCHKLRELIKEKNPTALKLESSVELTERSVAALERLANTFAPLSNAAFRTRRRNSVLEDVIRTCLDIRRQRLRARKVVVEITPANGITSIAIDPGELTTVFLNLLDNSLYWLPFAPQERERRIRFKITHLDSGRVGVQVDDSGPGIPPGNEERIFWPGVTRKKDGLGMGLTVVAEIITQHKGKIGLITPGFLAGASFRFDLPIAKANG